MDQLPDGSYDVVVVDASDEPDDVIALELVLVAGPDKGAVFGIRARRLGREATSLMGLPATLEVRDGAPSLQFD
jgi:hypothetical protein